MKLKSFFALVLSVAFIFCSFGIGTGMPPAAPHGPYVLCQSGTPSVTTGNTANQTLATCYIPSSSIGVNGSIVVWSIWQYPNTSNTKNLFYQLGGTQFWTYAATTTNSYTSAQMIADQGSYQNQYYAPYTTASAATNISTISVNMATGQNLTIVGNTSLQTASAPTGASGVACNGTSCTVTVTTPGGNNFPTGIYIYGNGTTMTGANANCANGIGTATLSTVKATYISATQFSFPWTNCANGTTNTTTVGQFAPFSSLQLLQYTVTVYPSIP